MYLVGLYLYIEPPSAPTCPKISPLSTATLELFWTAPNDSLCITSYIITLTNISEGNASFLYQTDSTSTSVNVSGLTKGARYFFTVAGIDTGNRIGRISLQSEAVTFDGKLKEHVRALPEILSLPLLLKH